jgi:hypothetical protein
MYPILCREVCLQEPETYRYTVCCTFKQAFNWKHEEEGGGGGVPATTVSQHVAGLCACPAPVSAGFLRVLGGS